MDEVKTDYSKENIQGESIYEIAERLYEDHQTINDLTMAIANQIMQHGSELSEKRIAKTIMESRFTPPQEAYNDGMVSCGAMSSIGAAMLRHLGYEVKLIHGEVPESVDHAWISVKDKDSDEWTQYDLTRRDGKVTPEHIVKLTCDNWEDIKEQIKSDHLTLHERREARKLANSSL